MNRFFDPTLEGAQVAAILFTLFGIGIMCDRMSPADTESEKDLADGTVVPRQLDSLTQELDVNAPTLTTLCLPVEDP